MLTLPDPPVQSPLSIARRPVLRQTPLAEEMGVHLRRGLEMSPIGQAIENLSLPEAERAPDTVASRPTIRRSIGRRVDFMDEESYRASPFFRDGVEWDQRMTPERAEALADIVDKRNYRQSLIERSPGGAGRAVMGFGAALVGAAPDPINYVPFFGPAARALAVARLGPIGGRVTIGSAEGAFGAAIASPFVASEINKKGGNIGAGDVAMDIVLSAILGGTFGAGAGLISKAQTAKALRTAGAKRETLALQEAIEDIADDVPVDVRGLTMLSRSLPDAVARPEVRLLPDAIEGRRLPDALPRARLQSAEEAVPQDSNVGAGADQTVARQFRKVVSARQQELGPGQSINQDAISREGALVGERVRQRSDLPPARPRSSTDFAAGRNALIRRVQDERTRFMLDLATRDQKARAAIAQQAGEARAEVGADVGGRPSGGRGAFIHPAAREAMADARLSDVTERPHADPSEIPFREAADKAVTARVTDRPDYADVKAETLAEPELLEIEEMRKAGELDATDEALMRQADEVDEAAEKYAIGYETLAGCVVRHG